MRGPLPKWATWPGQKGRVNFGWHSPGASPLDWAASESVHHHPALNLGLVQRAGPPFLPASGAVSSGKGPNKACEATPLAEGLSGLTLARAASIAVGHHPALD